MTDNFKKDNYGSFHLTSPRSVVDLEDGASNNELRMRRSLHQGTQTKTSAAINLGKCICGAGSFALPHVFLIEGALGGTLAMAFCAYLATVTMQSLNRSRFLAVQGEPGRPPPASYVELTELVLGEGAARLVFGLTLAAALGVCSTYIVFVGQTLASLSSDETNDNIVRAFAPDVGQTTWKLVVSLAVMPLSLVRDYGIFAFTSALGVAAVLAGIVVTLAYGILVDPGQGAVATISAISHLRMWPQSLSDAFGGSFGTIVYLFCVNVTTFPIMNSMKNARRDYDGAVSSSVTIIWVVNAVFTIVCLAIYGDDTQDLVLQNLDNGPYLTSLKMLLCIDLLFTFPVVYAAGRQILEDAVLGGDSLGKSEDKMALWRVILTAGAVATCFGFSLLGGFGTLANLVGGVAVGSLALIFPPAIAIALSREKNGSFHSSEVAQWMIGSFGMAVVSYVMYYTIAQTLS